MSIAPHGIPQWLTDARRTSGENSPPSTLAEAIARTIKSTGDVGLLAMETGLNRSSLYHWSTAPENPSGGHRSSLPASAIVPLTRTTGRYDILSRLALECGGVFVLLPSPAEASESTRAYVEQLAELTREFADVQVESAEGIADGCLTPEEVQRIEHQGHELIAATHRLILLAQQAAKRKSLAKARPRGDRS